MYLGKKEKYLKSLGVYEHWKVKIELVWMRSYFLKLPLVKDHQSFFGFGNSLKLNSLARYYSPWSQIWIHTLLFFDHTFKIAYCRNFRSINTSLMKVTSKSKNDKIYKTSTNFFFQFCLLRPSLIVIDRNSDHRGCRVWGSPLANVPIPWHLSLL